MLTRCMHHRERGEIGRQNTHQASNGSRKPVDSLYDPRFQLIDQATREKTHTQKTQFTSMYLICGKQKSGCCTKPEKQQKGEVTQIIFIISLEVNLPA